MFQPVLAGREAEVPVEGGGEKRRALITALKSDLIDKKIRPAQKKRGVFHAHGTEKPGKRVAGTLAEQTRKIVGIQLKIGGGFLARQRQTEVLRHVLPDLLKRPLRFAGAAPVVVRQETARQTEQGARKVGARGFIVDFRKQMKKFAEGGRRSRACVIKMRADRTPLFRIRRGIVNVGAAQKVGGVDQAE